MDFSDTKFEIRPTTVVAIIGGRGKCFEIIRALNGRLFFFFELLLSLMHNNLYMYIRDGGEKSRENQISYIL